jgi:hypothetical protein
MSHVAKIEIEIKDLEALRAACERIGCVFVEGQQTYQWYGIHVGDYPLPQGFKKEELGRCEHAIKVPGATYEVGVVTRRDGKPGYTLMWDFYSSGGLQRVLGANGGRLVQAYATEAAKRAARRAGHSVTETVNANGAIVLRVRMGN